MRETSSEIDGEAARWAARLDRGSLSADEQQALERWAGADSRRQGALARAMAVSAYCDDGAALAAGREPLDASPRRIGERVIGRRGFLYGAAAAVGGLTVLAAGWSSYGQHEFHTRKGEFRSVRLEDGTVMWLNTDTSVRVRYTDARRSVSLARGEALFDVAKDRSRPLVVRAAGVDIRAVGTRFSVSNISADRKVEVLVQEGLVDVVKARRSETPVRLAAGAHAIAPKEGTIAVSNPGVDIVSRAFSWRQGMLNFEDVTLAEAARTFARYSDAPILLDDPTVSRLTVTGLFASRDPAGFANAVAASFNLRVRRDSDGIHLSR